MEYSTIKRVEQNSAWYWELLKWFESHAVAWTSLILGWKALDLGFKFLKDGRDTAIRSIVQDEINKSMAPKLDNLSDKIEKLGDAVFELRSKL